MVHDVVKMGLLVGAQRVGGKESREEAASQECGDKIDDALSRAPVTGFRKIQKQYASARPLLTPVPHQAAELSL